VKPTKFGLRDLLAEALAGLVQRPGRSVLTMLGTVLGVGSFVAVLGLTSTASGQIDQRFNALVATEVIVDDAAEPGPVPAPSSFPADAEQRMSRLNGVNEAGTYWSIGLKTPRISALPGRGAAQQGESSLPLVAASPGLLRAVRPTLASGVLYNQFHDTRRERVVVLGKGAADQLGVKRLDSQPAIFVNGAPFTVVGIIADVERQPELLLSVLIPTQTAQRVYGAPVGGEDGAKMLVDTKLGAAALIARQAPFALRPDRPELLQVDSPPDPRQLRNGVAGDLSTLFVILAGICLLVGAFGIANTTLVGVLERRSEIGLRRALGAQRRHVAGQFLTESTALGLLGGVVGTAFGLLAIVGVTIAKHWTAIVEPWAVLPAPLLGASVGLLAGLYPAMRAASVEPLDALRQ
jgi:putative ABC transport system permease protein